MTRKQFREVIQDKDNQIRQMREEYRKMKETMESSYALAAKYNEMGTALNSLPF